MGGGGAAGGWRLSVEDLGVRGQERQDGGMIWELKETIKAAMLFDGWRETMIWSCLPGVMGKIYVDSLEKPVSAMAVLGDFVFLAGEPEREFIDRKKSETNGCGPDTAQRPGERGGSRIIVPRDEGWAKLIEECLGDRAKKTVRYAIKKEPDVFDRERLQRIVDRLPGGYELNMIDEELFKRCSEEEWSSSWVEQYKEYDTYRRYGLGVVMLKDGEPVSGASSYTGYIGGIEVQIDTREDYRRRGLALICGAKLILECLRRGWYPSWDAQNRWSVGLAEKLGYHFDHEYAAYVVADSTI